MAAQDELRRPTTCHHSASRSSVALAQTAHAFHAAASMNIVNRRRKSSTCLSAACRSGSIWKPFARLRTSSEAIAPIRVARWFPALSCRLSFVRHRTAMARRQRCRPLRHRSITSARPATCVSSASHIARFQNFMRAIAPISAKSGSRSTAGATPLQSASKLLAPPVFLR